MLTKLKYQGIKKWRLVFTIYNYNLLASEKMIVTRNIWRQRLKINGLTGAKLQKNILGIKGGHGGKVATVYPSGRGTVKCKIPKLYVFDHELVRSLHVV